MAFDIASLLSGLQQPLPGPDPNDPQIKLANSLIAEQPGQGTSYLQQANDLLAQQKEQEAKAASTKSQWHGFFDNVKNNPTFGQALGILGQALASPGSFAENLGKGTNAVSQVFAQQKEKDKAEAEKLRQRNIQEFSIKSQATQMDEQARQQRIGNQLTAANIFSNDKKTKEDARYKLAELTFQGANYDIAKQNAGTAAMNAKSEADLRTKQTQLVDAQIKKMQDKLKVDGFYQPDKTDTPEWVDIQNQANQFLRDKISGYNGTPTEDMKNKWGDEALTKAIDGLRDKKTAAEEAIRAAAIGGANNGPTLSGAKQQLEAIEILKKEIANQMPNAPPIDVNKRLTEITTQMTGALGSGGNSVNVPEAKKVEFKQKYGGDLLGITKDGSEYIIKYKDKDGNIQYKPASSFN